jgi:molecular chaperone DnaK
MGRIVGIDLGTTNSVVAVLEAGRPHVIANAEGGRTTPSVVGYSKDQELLVGQLARRQLVLSPRNTFSNLKRFVGRDWEELEDSSLAVPYTVRANDRGQVRVPCPVTEREYAPEELVASIIRKLVDDASTYLGETVEAAVVTVPAYFNDAQRQATRDAGRLAGISVERILNEPTAAALAYGFDRSAVRRVLVFDLGGGTFDVSLLRIANGVFDVKATNGDTQLGGNDFDQRIVDWIADAFQAEHGVDLRRDRQALQRLTEAAEKAKQELSGVLTTPISLPFIATGENGPLHVETNLDRSTFEGLCPDLLDRLLMPVQTALRDSGWAADDIDDVVLVGGATRMPMVQQLVRTLVPLDPCQSVNPDEVVAIGACRSGRHPHRGTAGSVAERRHTTLPWAGDRRWSDEGVDPAQHPDSCAPVRCVQHVGAESVLGGDPRLARRAADGFRQQVARTFPTVWNSASAPWCPAGSGGV